MLYSFFRRLWKLFFVLPAIVFFLHHPAEAAETHTFKIGTESFLLDDKPLVIRCGEIHFARVPREYWRQRLRMCKAMGLNAVCVYLFWNFHEWEPGKFDWAGEKDAAEFCRIAQEEGLWVLLRSGPYVCAEWEMGGLPWWLLKKDGEFLRTRDPDFMKASRAWLQQVGKQLAPLQVTKGGPILMVQVENEYGFYGKDNEYIKQLGQDVTDAGFTIPQFVCNPSFALNDGLPPEFLKVVNFSSNAAGNFKTLREVQPNRPLMSGEFYSGWFDLWGNPHNSGNLNSYLSNLEYMLKNKMSFSIYMAHGGTSFGLWAGATGPKPNNLAFRPDASSYDYAAPISEAGWVTPKFEATRNLITKYLAPNETLPDPPAKNPVSEFPAVELKETSALFENLPKPVADTQLRQMEKYGQGRGCILYRTTLPAGPATTLSAKSVRDFAWVYLDGKKVGRMDRRYRVFSLALPARSKTATLDILVEAMGRVNFGPEIHDRKGLESPVTLQTAAGTSNLMNWQIFNLGLEDSMLANLKWKPATAQKQPAFWRGEFSVTQAADTFLDVSTWGKGVVWINGRCLGRFWNIGPTQTMYLPAPWLKAGKNQVVVLDLLGPEKPTLSGRNTPILNKLRSELDFQPPAPQKTELLLDPTKATQGGSLRDSDQPQSVMFAQPATGRQIAFEMLSAQNGQPFAAISEFDLLDEAGKPLPRDKWTIAFIDSEETAAENGSVAGIMDKTGQIDEFWHSEWSRRKAPYPHTLVIDLGATTRVAGFRYTPRTGAGAGRVKDYRFYVGEKLAESKP